MFRGHSTPAWAARYIGLPFREHGRDKAGLDCWGLVRLVLKEQFGINVPSYTERYTSTLAQDELGRLIPREALAWHSVQPGREQRGDVLVMRMRGQPMHVGLVLIPGRMLHIEQGIDSAIEPYDSTRWRHRLVGIYRHGELSYA